MRASPKAFQNVRITELPGALPLHPRRGVAPGPPPGAFKWASEPHVDKRSVCYAHFAYWPLLFLVWLSDQWFWHGYAPVDIKEKVFNWSKCAILFQFVRIKLNFKLSNKCFNDRNWFAYVYAAWIIVRINSMIVIKLAALKLMFSS